MDKERQGADAPLEVFSIHGDPATKYLPSLIHTLYLADNLSRNNILTFLSKVTTAYFLSSPILFPLLKLVLRQTGHHYAGVSLSTKEIIKNYTIQAATNLFLYFCIRYNVLNPFLRREHLCYAAFSTDEEFTKSGGCVQTALTIVNCASEDLVASLGNEA